MCDIRSRHENVEFTVNCAAFIGSTCKAASGGLVGLPTVAHPQCAHVMGYARGLCTDDPTESNIS